MCSRPFLIQRAYRVAIQLDQVGGKRIDSCLVLSRKTPIGQAALLESV